MYKGKIVKDGGYDELIAQNGTFAELVARQRFDDTAYAGMTTAFWKYEVREKTEPVSSDEIVAVISEITISIDESRHTVI